jgi:hypothetical protein
LITELKNFDSTDRNHKHLYEIEILNSLFDVRFSLFRKYTGFKSFLEISENTFLTESLKYITPTFL